MFTFKCADFNARHNGLDGRNSVCLSVTQTAYTCTCIYMLTAQTSQLNKRLNIWD